MDKIRTNWGKHKHFNVSRARVAFLAKTQIDPSGCWLWTGAKQLRGYGILGLMGTGWLAHRASWFFFKHEHPMKNVICHRCDNTSCVNPDHLFIGTQTDNILDMERKNRARHPRGEAHGRAKLTVVDVLEIRRLHASGMAIRAIARQYPQVDRATVDAVVKRVTWVTT